MVPPPDGQAAYIKPSDAAEYYGVSSKTLARWEQEGRLPSTRRTVGGHRRYNRAELLSVIAARPAAPPDEEGAA